MKIDSVAQPGAALFHCQTVSRALWSCTSCTTNEHMRAYVEICTRGYAEPLYVARANFTSYCVPLPPEFHNCCVVVPEVGSTYVEMKIVEP
eukprot:scaffold56522_cov59-Attheya_sp.AAC.3